MNLKKYFSLIFIMIICIIAGTNNVYADSPIIYKLKPKYLTTDFNFKMMAATVTQDDHTFSSVGNFRTNKDLAGMSWETEDVLSHIDLKYPTDSDFSGVILEYDYSLSGYTELMNSEISPVITIETNSGEIYYVRLWNYVVDRPLDDWEIGASQQYETTIRFPEGRTPGNATGSTGRIVLDFDNLYAGWAPWYWTEEDEWVPMPEWEKVPVDDIKSIMWSFVPVGYNWETQDMSYLSDSYEYKVDFSNWNVYGDTFLRTEPKHNQFNL
ncbi:MAG: hypothetical protein HPY70_07900 [Firmicutes bacterium]|nr:hypothetical protein [Bacillota bacterium]